MLNIIPITPALTHHYKQARLCALEDSPTAFASTHARELQLTETDWHNRAISLDGLHRVGFLALEAAQPVGIVACFRDTTAPTHADLISMWVAPTHRATGLATALLEAVHHWAATHAITHLRLLVTSINAPAIALYTRYGFTPTGHTEPYPNDPALHELEMILPLSPK